MEGNNWIYPKKDWMGSKETYRIGMEWLSDMDYVYDWGCGKCFAQRFCDAIYIGIDGSTDSGANYVTDLTEFNKKCDSIFMRHVLEHNENWRAILANALAQFQRKMVLITFKEFEPGREDVVNIETHWDKKTPLPVINLAEDDLREMINPYLVEEIIIKKTGDKRERIFYLSKEA